MMAVGLSLLGYALLKSANPGMGWQFLALGVLLLMTCAIAPYAPLRSGLLGLWRLVQVLCFLALGLLVAEHLRYWVDWGSSVRVGLGVVASLAVFGLMGGTARVVGILARIFWRAALWRAPG